MTDPAECSALVRAQVVRLFSVDKRDRVLGLLATGSSFELPGAAGASPAFIERVQCAALKVSGGDIDALAQALDLARRDWRDLLVAADFAHDTVAHLKWAK